MAQQGLDLYCTPRVTAAMMSSFPAGATLCLIAQTKGVDHSNRKATFHCPLSGVTFVTITKDPAILTEHLGLNSEIVVRVMGDEAELLTAAVVNDDFDYTTYGGLVEIIWSKHSGHLFHNVVIN